MAVDGVKIIDSDTAHDTYWGIMDMFDNELSIEKIKKKFPLKLKSYYDDLDTEIYITSAGLAYWEIGIMDKENLKIIEKVLDKGIGVKVFGEDDEKEGKARQRVLNRFWKKINKVNAKPRKPKKYRKVVNFHFEEDEVLIFKTRKRNYGAVICCQIHQYRGHCNYHLVPTTYSNKKKPTILELKRKDVLGRQIGSGYSKEITKQKQVGIERIWNFVGGENNFFFGLTKIGISHKDFFDLKDKYERIGKLKINNSFKETGSIGYESNFERFEKIVDDVEDYIKTFRTQKYPIEILIE